MYSPDKSNRYFDTLMDGPNTCGLGVGDVVVIEAHVLYSSVASWFDPRGTLFFFDLSLLQLLNDINAPIMCLRMLL